MLPFHFQDIDECSPNPCQNGGTCADGVNNYTCACVAGYSGYNCTTSKLEILHGISFTCSIN